MSKWHYQVAKYTLKDLADPENLNMLGEQGWELVCLDRISGTQSGMQMKWLAVFKKPVEGK